jgi:hypothetical protein
MKSSGFAILLQPIDDLLKLLHSFKDLHSQESGRRNSAVFVVVAVFGVQGRDATATAPVQANTRIYVQQRNIFV